MEVWKGQVWLLSSLILRIFPSSGVPFEFVNLYVFKCHHFCKTDSYISTSMLMYFFVSLENVKKAAVESTNYFTSQRSIFSWLKQTRGKPIGLSILVTHEPARVNPFTQQWSSSSTERDRGVIPSSESVSHHSNRLDSQLMTHDISWSFTYVLYIL